MPITIIALCFMATGALGNGTTMYGYMLLAFKKPKSPNVTTGGTSIIDMEEECGLRNERV